MCKSILNFRRNMVTDDNLRLVKMANVPAAGVPKTTDLRSLLSMNYSMSET